VNIGSKWSRCDLFLQLLGEGAQCDLIGLDLGNGSSHIDRHLFIEHLAPRTLSSQLFKGIFDDEGSGSFYGKIKVYKGADGTSAKQVNRNLLLSPSATVNTRPQLEIDTDDVACTHGATVGQLDENAVFFLRSRGLSEDAARTLLTEAFAREIIGAFQVGSQRDDLERRVLAWLGKVKP
jgi:Fe-S cluster assembly protein SufD